MRQYADKDIPDSVRLTAHNAAENMLEITKKLGLINDLPEVTRVSYENDTLFVTIDEETIAIPG